MKSALYEGRVHHHRAGPRAHSFGYRVFLWYLDLDEVDGLFARHATWSTRRPNLVWLRRADYLGDPRRPLRDEVLDRVERDLGRRPASVRMLTHLRTLGYVFNPVTFYYCFAADGALDAVVAEITNTPWRERHAYVLDARDAAEGPDGRSWRFPKTFHVSPFFDLDLTYDWRLTEPGEELEVDMHNERAGERVFRARLACRRRPLSGRAALAALARHPLLPLRVHLAIYLQAALLWWKRTPFFPHPAERTTQPTS